MADDIRNFDGVYRRRSYYGDNPSDGLVACVAEYEPHPLCALDIGCGQGRNALWLASRGFDVIAIDTSARAVEVTKAAADLAHLPIQTINADVTGLELQPNAFGLVVALTTLNHIMSADHKALAQQIGSALALGGILYSVVFTTADPGFKRKDLASECSHLVQHYFESGELRDLFSALDLCEYTEYTKLDSSHGPPHYHGKAKLIARRTA